MKKSTLLPCAVVLLLPLVAMSFRLDSPEPLDPENFEMGQIGKFPPTSEKTRYGTASAEPAEDELIVYALRLDNDTYVPRGHPFILKGVDRSKIEIGKDIKLTGVYKVIKSKTFSGRSYWVIRVATSQEKAAYDKKTGGHK